MKFVPTVMLFCQISEVFWDCSLHGETENHKDSPSSAVADASGDSRHKNISTRSSAEGAMKDRLYVQLDQAMDEVENSRR
ncbi:hypothetical protein Ancab_034130 [Ancistrocladus abbreviatus]